MPLISAIIPVYRDSHHANITIAALLHCKLPATHELEIIVVEDGSADPTAECISQAHGSRVHLIVNAVNQGRAATRNRGAKAAAGDLLLFLDSDCKPADDQLLMAHLNTLKEADVSMGIFSGQATGFWYTYQALAANRRLQRARRQPAIAFTSANIMLKRSCFEAVGGFDQSYRGYGFEDRALACQLQQRAANLQLSPQAKAEHQAILNLAILCKKMQEAARDNAPRFAAHFPHVYRQLGYAILDARLHPWLHFPQTLFSPLRLSLIRWLDCRLDSRWLPFRWRVLGARLLMAASYLQGSVEAASRNSR